MTRLVLAAAFLIAASTLAGCASPGPKPDLSGPLRYEVFIDDIRRGSVNYTVHEAIQVKDGALQARSTIEVEIDSDEDGINGKRFSYVDVESGRTVLFVNKCRATDLSPCKDLVIVDWPEAPVDFMGAFAFPTLPVEEGTITLAPGTPWERQATVTRSPDGVKVEPERTIYADSACSVLTNVVTVDPETGLVLTCTRQFRNETLVFRHVSGSLPPGIGRAQGSFPRVADPKPLDGILPQDADYGPPSSITLAEAFRVAVEKSPDLRSFLASHPRAGLAHAGRSGGGSERLLGSIPIHSFEVYEIQLFPGDGETNGYEVQVVRSHPAGRTDLPPEYQVYGGSWDVNGSLPRSADLPAAAVPLSAIKVFDKALGGAPVPTASVGHTNLAGIGARYQYSLDLGTCENSTCLLPYAMFDALDGRLSYGLLTHAQVRSLVVSGG